MQQVTSTTTDNASNFAMTFRNFGPQSVPQDSDCDDTELPGSLSDVTPIYIEGDLQEKEPNLPVHRRCTAHTLKLPAITDVESIPLWSTGGGPFIKSI